MADLDPKKTEDKSTATIPLSFSSEAIDAGDYTMTVVASEQSNPSKILAFQTKKFVLTSKTISLKKKLDSSDKCHYISYIANNGVKTCVGLSVNRRQHYL